MISEALVSRKAPKQRLVLFSLCAAALLCVAAFGAHLCPYDPYAQQYDAVLQAPSWDHWLGTDRYGRDMLSRILAGAQLSIFSALALVAMIAFIGTGIGLLCGYYGGKADALCMRLADVCLAFPSLIFAMAIAAVLNGGIHNAVVALGAVSWPKYARLVRSRTLALKEQKFILAAQMAGSLPRQILIRHILPNCLGTIVVTAALS